MGSPNPKGACALRETKAEVGFNCLLPETLKGVRMTYLEEHNPEFVRELLFLCALITIEEELKREELVPF